MRERKAFVILVLILSLAFSSCGDTKTSVPEDTIDFFGDGFSWDLTVEGAEAYIRKNQVNESPIEIEKNEQLGFTTVNDDYYLFGFHDRYDGKLVRVCINAPNLEPTLKRWFGEPSEETTTLDSPWLKWHGILGGKSTTVTYMGALGILEFSLDDYWNTAESIFTEKQ